MKNLNVNFNLNCNTKNRLYQNVTNNGRTGFALTIANGSRRLGTVYNVSQGKKTVRQGIARLGSGAQGVVFLACTSPGCSKNIVIKVSPFDKNFSSAKQPAKVEFDIQKSLYKIVPNHVPIPYKLIHCSNFIPESNFRNRTSIFDYTNQYVMYSEYAHGGTLKEWLRKMGSRITDNDMARMIRQVISTLKKINGKYPEFRHNDLHLGNILVDDTGDFPRLLIADFGLARLTARGSNPIVNSGNHRNAGITNRTSVKYDAHFFLNAVDNAITNALPATKAFLARVLPTGYRGANSRYVKQFRIIDGAPNARLPTFDQILADPFLRTSNRYNSPNLARPLSSPRVRVRAGGDAASAAAAALANVPGVSVSVTNRRPTAAEFLRMSPRSRAALMTRPRAPNASRSVVVRNYTTGRGANRERYTVRRVPAGTVRRVNFGMAGPGNATRRERVRPEFLPEITRTEIPRRELSEETESRRRLSSEAGPSVPIVARTPTRIVSPPRRRIANTREYRAARRAAGRGSPPRRRAAAARTRPPPPPRAPRVAPSSSTRAKQILNAFANSINNQRTITRRMLKNKLKSFGFSNESSNAKARAWEAQWIANRQNVNAAVRMARNGKNLNRLGFPQHVASVARRRVAENLSRGPNGRIRSKKALLTSKKKEELLNIARRHGLSNMNSKTKQEIVNALYG